MDEWLDDTWILRFHSSTSSDWTLQSYQTLMNVSDVRDVWVVTEAMRPFVLKGMFFIMREHVFPVWDDEYNIGGSCVSFKIPNDDAHACLERVIQVVLGGDQDAINGVSSSPKRGFVIIKLWFSKVVTASDVNIKRFLPDYDGEIICRTNRENIIGNQQ